MKTRIITALLFSLFMFTTGPAVAGDVEITAMTGFRTSDSLRDETSGTRYQLDDSPALGLIISTRRDNEAFYDFYFSRQDTELQVSSSPVKRELRLDYYHIGGTVYYEHELFEPFATGGLGLTHARSSDPLLSSETRASLSFGGGLVVKLADNIGLRFEARLLGTFIDGSGSILCSGGSCSASINGDMYIQLDTGVGLAVGF